MRPDNTGLTEDWLIENGKLVPTPLFFGDCTKNHTLVSLVENRNVSLVGIVYDPTEWNIHTEVNDARPRRWYEIPTDKLLEACPEHKYRLAVSSI